MSKTKATASTSNNLASVLGHMKDINSNRNDHMDALKILKYDSNLISPAKFDAILLKAIDALFIGVSKDIIRMSLGLMSGYEREIKIEIRRECYLKKSNFTKDFTRIKGIYGKASEKQKENYKNTLINAETKRLEKLADFLLEISKKGIFEEYIKDLAGYYDNATNAVILSKPGYTEESNGSGQKKDTAHFLLKFFPFTICGLFILLIIALVLIAIGKGNETTTIIDNAKEIKIEGNSIVLHPGEEYDIIVKTTPSYINPHDLFYVSSNPSVVSVGDIHNGHIKATKQLANNARNDSTIIVHNIDGKAQDTITVTVETPDSRKSEGIGDNGGETYDGVAQ